MNGNQIHLIEAKRVLNRNVIGQVEVGNMLFVRDFEFNNIKQIALCASGEPDLEWYCKQKDIQVVLYKMKNKKGQNSSSLSFPNDLRNSPDENRKKAFLQGWEDATNGKLYKNIREQKTHQNIGNLFGWIYGNRDKTFQLRTWNRYVKEYYKND